uniref:Uncharacterized protein n=1 Tax=viral metagenome TaxID=1070528 RepID=A0A6H2A3T8_9ZZZZ
MSKQSIDLSELGGKRGSHRTSVDLFGAMCCNITRRILWHRVKNGGNNIISKIKKG